jgi:hypothetical protein
MIPSALSDIFNTIPEGILYEEDEESMEVRGSFMNIIDYINNSISECGR